jgi:hypothetical protein
MFSGKEKSEYMSPFKRVSAAVAKTVDPARPETKPTRIGFILILGLSSSSLAFKMFTIIVNEAINISIIDVHTFIVTFKCVFTAAK